MTNTKSPPAVRHSRAAASVGASALLALTLAGCTSGGTAASACEILVDPVAEVTSQLSDLGSAVTEFDFAKAASNATAAKDALQAADEQIAALGGEDAGYLEVLDTNGKAVASLDTLATTLIDIDESGIGAQLIAAAAGTPVEGADVTAQIDAASKMADDTSAVQEAFSDLAGVCRGA